MANITKTAATITINDVEFSSDYIKFRAWDGVRIPTPECFIHVWQKSNNNADFRDKMERLYHVWCGNRAKLRDNLWLTSAGMSQRATKYRANGVKLKHFSAASNWSQLQQIAHLSL